MNMSTFPETVTNEFYETNTLSWLELDPIKGETPLGEKCGASVESPAKGRPVPRGDAGAKADRGEPELKGSVGEGPNRTNYCDQHSVKIPAK